MYRHENIRKISDILSDVLHPNLREKELLEKILLKIQILTVENIFPPLTTTQHIVNNIVRRIVKLYHPDIELFIILQMEHDTLCKIPKNDRMYNEFYIWNQ